MTAPPTYYSQAITGAAYDLDMCIRIKGKPSDLGRRLSGAPDNLSSSAFVEKLNPSPPTPRLSNFFPRENYQEFSFTYPSNLRLGMPSFDLFEYPEAPPACSEDSLFEKLNHEQIEGLLGEEQLPDWQKNNRPRWKRITLRVCEIFVMLVCILMFVLGLRWQLNANQHCLELQNFYCRHFREIYSTSFKKALNETVSTCIKANRQSLPSGAIQRLSNLAIAISWPPEPRNRR